MNEELAIYSDEPLWKDLYNTNFKIQNGIKLRLANINRGNNKNVIYLDIFFLGKAYVNIYRGYRENGVLKYERSNHELINNFNTDGERKIYYFQDFTPSNKRYINYYVEIEALLETIIRPYNTGIYFDDILSSNSFTNQINCSLENDINSNPIEQQIYDKITSFKLVVNRGYIQQVVNVIEKPFYFINKISDCLDNSTTKLANRSISTQYVTGHTKYVEITLTNLEEI